MLEVQAQDEERAVRFFFQLGESILEPFGTNHSRRLTVPFFGKQRLDSQVFLIGLQPAVGGAYRDRRLTTRRPRDTDPGHGRDHAATFRGR